MKKRYLGRGRGLYRLQKGMLHVWGDWLLKHVAAAIAALCLLLLIFAAAIIISAEKTLDELEEFIWA